MNGGSFLRRAGLGIGTFAVAGAGVLGYRAYDQRVLQVGQGAAYEPWSDWKQHQGLLPLVGAAILAPSPRIVGGMLTLGLVTTRGKIPVPIALTLLALAALPFAALTWWSVATPLIGLLLLAVGVLALAPRRPSRTSSSPAPGHRVAARAGRSGQQNEGWLSQLPVRVRAEQDASA